MANPYHVLIVDDDPSMRATLRLVLKDNYELHEAGTGAEALAKLDTTDITIVLLDIKLPDMSGLDVLNEIKSINEMIEVIMITVLDDVKTAVSAMKLGAYDYITKDLRNGGYEKIKQIVQRVVSKLANGKELLYLKEEMRHYVDKEIILGKTQRMKQIYELVKKTAKLHTNVLLFGESGTGKELIARLIHKESYKADKPFVTVNIPAIPSELTESILFGHEKGAFTGATRQHVGKFELAHGGTIFLDEIADLKLGLQAKLLRAIQEGEVERVGGTKVIRTNVRLITSSKIDLQKAVRKGEFRDDLFYRINVVPIHLLPLRERLVDIPDLTQLFVKRYNRLFGKSIEKVEPEVFEVFKSYHWPGNIRELENVVERMVALSDNTAITIKDLPLDFSIAFKSKTATNEEEGANYLERSKEVFERNLILKVLEQNDWNRKLTAEALGITYGILKYKINRLSLFDVIKRKGGRKSARVESL